MAAEKLTRSRLMQVLIMMAILITAFFWRTFEYTENIAAQGCEVQSGPCHIEMKAGTAEVWVAFLDGAQEGKLFVRSGVTLTSAHFSADGVEGSRLAPLESSPDVAENPGVLIFNLPLIEQDAEKAKVILLFGKQRIDVTHLY